MRYFVSGAQIGELTSNGNMDPLLQDYAQTVNTIRNWTPNPAGAPFRWNTPGGATRGTFGAGSGYDPINPYGAGANATQSSYTVRGGETLQAIAANVWGDAAMWYLLASANGMSGGETLAAGQSLIIPDRVTNIHNNSSTFEVYDPNRAMGDLSPTTAKPPKSNKCAVVGQILIVIVAVAVTALTAGAGAVLAGAAPGILSGMGAIAAGTTSLSVGALAAIGAVAGAVGSIASQAVGIATGVQSKFNWKGVAMGAISGAVSAGIGAVGPFGNVSSKFVQGALNAGLSSAVSQGIGVATGLQKKFDFAGVAGAALAGGISARLGGRTDSLQKNLSIANIITHAGISAASGLANAGARSIITGTSFGDNIMAALPDIIGGTIGNIVSAVAQGGGSRGTSARGPLAEHDSSASTPESGDTEAIMVRATRHPLLSDAEYAARQAEIDADYARRYAADDAAALSQVGTVQPTTILGSGSIATVQGGSDPYFHFYRDNFDNPIDAAAVLVINNYVGGHDQNMSYTNDLISNTDVPRLEQFVLPLLDRMATGNTDIAEVRDGVRAHVSTRNAAADRAQLDLVKSGISVLETPTAIYRVVVNREYTLENGLTIGGSALGAAGALGGKFVGLGAREARALEMGAPASRLSRAVRGWRELSTQVRRDLGMLGIDETRFLVDGTALRMNVRMIGAADPARAGALRRTMNYLQSEASGLTAITVQSGPVINAKLAGQLAARADSNLPYLGMHVIRSGSQWHAGANRETFLLRWWRQ